MSSLRVISGRFKGQRLLSPNGIRPTQNRIKESMFNMLSRYGGKSFLDLYAGSGQVGIEAISNGFEDVVFVDNNNRCVAAIKSNLHRLNVEATVFKIDAIRFIKRLKQGFDIIFADPPYYMDGVYKELELLITQNQYIDSLIVFEASKYLPPPSVLSIVDSKRIGDTILWILQKP